MLGMDPSDASESVWRARLWKPKTDTTDPGWDPEGEIIERLLGQRCAADLYTTDLTGDGKTDLVVETWLKFNDGSGALAANSYAFTRRSYPDVQQLARVLGMKRSNRVPERRLTRSALALAETIQGDRTFAWHRHYIKFQATLIHRCRSVILPGLPPEG